MKAHARLSYIARSWGQGDKRRKDKIKTKTRCQGETERHKAKVKEDESRVTGGTFQLSGPSVSRVCPHVAQAYVCSQLRKEGLRMQLHGMTGTQVPTPGSGFKTEKEKSRLDLKKKKRACTVMITSRKKEKQTGC